MFGWDPERDVERQRHQHAELSVTPDSRLPCTPAALQALRADAERLELALGPAQAAARLEDPMQDREAPTCVPYPELHLVASRLQTLRQVLLDIEVVDDTNVVVIGSRIVVRDGSGTDETYIVVAPGKADPRAGCISALSPLGRAVLHRRVGDVVDVDTPGDVHRFALIEISDASTVMSRTNLESAR